MDLLFSLVLILAYVLTPHSTNSTPSTIKQYPSNQRIQAALLTPEQKRRAEQLTSLFENGTPQFNYSVIEDLGDGRGYTAGRSGFTTATGDAYLVVQRYTEQVPMNPLARYLAPLEQLADEESGSTSSLTGFTDAWQQASTDSRFRTVQDAVTDELYYRPAMTVCDELGITSALGRAILYDTIIQHGGGDDEDSLSAIVARTTTSLRGTPKNGIPEFLWLHQFLELRREDLLHPKNRTTQAVWAVSVGRIAILQKLLTDQNFDLHGPILVETDEYDASIL